MHAFKRILVLLLLLVPWGNLLAQTSSNGSANQAADGDAAERPAWAWGPSLGPVKVPPPLSCKDDKIIPLSYEEPPLTDKESSPELKSTTASSPPASAGSAALGKKQKAISLSASHREPLTPLSPPSKTNSRDPLKKIGDLPPLMTVASSLGMVLGIFLLIVWLIRRAAPQGLTRLPNEAFELLGRAPLAGKQQVHLLRCGHKLLLVSITPAGTETLTEITDPLEVDRLAGLCRQAHPHSSTAAFRQIFEQLAPSALTAAHWRKRKTKLTTCR